MATVNHSSLDYDATSLMFKSVIIIKTATCQGHSLTSTSCPPTILAPRWARPQMQSSEEPGVIFWAGVINLPLTPPTIYSLSLWKKNLNTSSCCTQMVFQCRTHSRPSREHHRSGEPSAAGNAAPHCCCSARRLPRTWSSKVSSRSSSRRLPPPGRCLRSRSGSGLVAPSPPRRSCWHPRWGWRQDGHPLVGRSPQHQPSSSYWSPRSSKSFGTAPSLVHSWSHKCYRCYILVTKFRLWQNAPVHVKRDFSPEKIRKLTTSAIVARSRLHLRARTDHRASTMFGLVAIPRPALHLQFDRGNILQFWSSKRSRTRQNSGKF